MATLKQRQISKFMKYYRLCHTIINFLDALKQMFNLNQPQTKSSISEPVWKILIYDRIGQDIISPLISIKELRELGVTLFL